MKKYLSVVLLEDIPFEDLVHKMEKTFGIQLPYNNKKGRNIAEGSTDVYQILIIDRIDELSEVLCDENHTLEIQINPNVAFDYEKIESDLKMRFKNNKINWQYGIWSKTNADEQYRRIYPH
ncbi:hypothetical protein FC756_09070 [Lysinibacillus mangiferihumi]|uniref:Uncharacterized protein n=1 Tax=Lysinibacillus mangiferihumi TaxID=1130819 RepID=A0A4U2Z7J2_9BACI|nr:hypothetical protein [Lysinibacillus mangiferihumi]TKI69462.1 hypothetical protein FC756_09070 [Lysinibacillus mangiferihumi]